MSTERDPPAPPSYLRPIRGGREPLCRSFASLVEIIRNRSVELWGDERLRFDLMKHCPVIGDREMTDSRLASFREQIEHRFVDDSNPRSPKPLRFGTKDIEQAISLVAHENEFHPVEDYLRSLTWDGYHRLVDVATRILKVPVFDPEEGADGLLANQLVRTWFISAVARALQPGCKVDTMLILAGDQGAGKSTFFSALMPSEAWFCDSPIVIGSRDGFQTLHSSWVLEWGELESMRKSDENAVKAFLSSRVDTYRPPYGHFDVRRARRGVIVGSTNKDTFLRDETGDRRFWVVSTRVPRAGKAEMEQQLRGERDQLWAEAVYQYDAGERWWLDHLDDQERDKANEEYRERDVWADVIEDWLATNAAMPVPYPITTGCILEKALSKPQAQWTRVDEMRVANALKGAGYMRRRVRSGGARQYLWFRRDDSS